MDPFEKRRSQNRLALSAAICDGIKKKGITKAALAELMGANPSEVTRWTSGNHNFTLDTLSDLENVLEISLINRKTDNVVVQRLECTLTVEVAESLHYKMDDAEQSISTKELANTLIHFNGGMQATSLTISEH